jgi:hypothetical protein
MTAGQHQQLEWLPAEAGTPYCGPHLRDHNPGITIQPRGHDRTQGSNT